MLQATHRTVALLVAVGLVLVPSTAAGQATASPEDRDGHARRVLDATQVLSALAEAPDAAIPDYLLERAEAVVVIPSLVKGGFIIGAEHGRGVVSRRQAGGEWSPPAFVQLTGGSIGWQIGVQAIDLVLLIMNDDGLDQLLEDRFTIGGSVAVTAGPVGRNASAATNAQVNSGILAYSRAQGLFAGATFEGAALHADDDANDAVYGQTDLKAVLSSESAGSEWLDAIARWHAVVQALTTAGQASQ